MSLGRQKTSKNSSGFLVKVLEFQVQPCFLLRVLSRPAASPVDWASKMPTLVFDELKIWRRHIWMLGIGDVKGRWSESTESTCFFFTTKSWKSVGSYNNQSKTILQVVFLWYLNSIHHCLMYNKTYIFLQWRKKSLKQSLQTFNNTSTKRFKKKRNDFVSEQNTPIMTAPRPQSFLHPNDIASPMWTQTNWGNHTTRLHSKQRVTKSDLWFDINLRFYTSIKLKCKIRLPLCTLFWNTSDFAFSKVWYIHK